MIRVLHIADVHLGASFSAFGPLAGERQAQLLAAFRRLPELAEKVGAEAVVVAGDLLDSPNPGTDVVAVARQTLRRVAEHAPVFIVPGNHDPLSLAPALYRDPPEGVQIFCDPQFGRPISVHTREDALHVYGLAFDPAREREPLTGFERAPLPGAHLVLLHGSVPDAPHWSGSGNTLRLPPEQLRSLAVDYIGLGDFHRPRLPAEFGGIPAAYAGSFAGLDLTEHGPRGYLVVEIESGNSPRVEHHDAGVPQVALVGEVNVSGCETEAEVVETVARSVPARSIPVVRLTGQPAFPLDGAVVLAELRERFGTAGVSDETHFWDSARVDELTGSDTLAGHVARLGRARAAEAQNDDERRIAEHALRIALSALEIR